MDSHLASHWCSRYERQGHLKSRENTELSDLNMRTVPSSQNGRPFSGDDRKLKRCLPEFYTDKKYFDHYLEAESMYLVIYLAMIGGLIYQKLTDISLR